MVVLPPITAGHLALELDGLGLEPSWMLLVAEHPGQAVAEVAETLTTLGLAPRILAPAGPHGLQGEPTPDAIALVTGSWRWSDEDCYPLDPLRAAIRATWPRLIWITTAADADRLATLAPNFTSFFSPTRGTWTPEEEASADDHLARLRARYGLSDDDVIRGAEAGTLPQDADHHAWLILLDRGDLIGRP
jgi:hypothetical protein